MIRGPGGGIKEGFGFSISSCRLRREGSDILEIGRLISGLIDSSTPTIGVLKILKKFSTESAIWGDLILSI